MGFKDTLDKVNFLDIAKSEIKSAGYIIAATQVITRVNAAVQSAAKKTKNENVQKFVESAPGSMAIEFGLAAAAKKIPKIGGSAPIEYISKGLRVGALAKVGNKVVNKVLGKTKRDKKDKE